MQRISILMAVLLMAVLLLAHGVRAQEAAEPAPQQDREARLKQAAAHVAVLEVRLADGGDVVPRVQRPLFIFGDSTRSNGDGTLWAWGEKGRPLVLLETYRNTAAGGPRANAITLTSTHRVALTVPSVGRWLPEKSQIEPAPLPDAPPPAERDSSRLRQLKEQARRFTAHEFWDPDNSRFELRLLVQPVHRYTDEKNGLVDGRRSFWRMARIPRSCC